MRLGRQSLQAPDEAGQPADLALPGADKTLDEILACLKRVRKSVNYWTKESGRQGYLNFVTQFVWCCLFSDTNPRVKRETPFDV